MREKVFVTGHRPDKLGGYDFFSAGRTYVRAELEKEFRRLDPSEVVVGMGLGADMDAAVVAVSLGLYVVAAIPFVGQDSMWPAESRRHYSDMLAMVNRVVVVSDGGYAPEKMQRRNEWMVDYGDRGVAVFNGSRGGTWNCVQYAQRRGKPVSIIKPLEPANVCKPFRVGDLVA